MTIRQVSKLTGRRNAAAIAAASGRRQLDQKCRIHPSCQICQYLRSALTSSLVTAHPNPSRKIWQILETILTSKPPDFSLVLGGPLFQIFRRAHLAGEGLELLHRRLLIIPLVTWLPLMFLSVLDHQALARSCKIPFLYDVETYVRFLVALPILIAAELVVHRRISPLVRRFVERGIVRSQDLPPFGAAVNSALRVRDSTALELTLLVLVYTLGLWIWSREVALGEPTWYAMPDGKHLNLTLAGYWYALVSIPIFQFILLRWYMRLVIWFRLLWQISRLSLRLSPAHPDRSGGIGFLGRSSYAFGPVLFAQGALMSGLIASRVLYEGRPLLSFKAEAAGFVGFFVLIILGPLLMFTPLLERTRTNGFAEYGLLANRYAFGFEDEWLPSRGGDTIALPATADISPVYALDNLYSNVSKMRLVPFGSRDITLLAATTAAPLVPLTLTIFSVPDLAKFLIKILFH
jgi:hypothetical protein